MKKNRILKTLFSALFFLYPIFVFLGVKYFDAGLASLALCFVLIFRIFFLREPGNNPFGKVFEGVLWLVLAYNLVNYYFKSELALKLYPILMSAGICGIFLHSLWIGQPLVEKFARLHVKDLSALRLRYTHRLTWIWSIWLFLNTLIAAYTALYSNIEFWTFYNSLLTHLITGLLFASDLVYRRLILTPLELRQEEGHAIK